MVKTSVTTLYVVVTFSSLLILALSLTSLLSPNWTECTAIRNVTGAPDTVTDPPNDPFSGFVRFGVIYGHKEFNLGFGKRDRETFTVFKEYDGVFNTDYVIVSLVFMVSTVVFAGVSLFFGVMNVRMVPIETIHGRPGLYLWNGIGLLSGIISTSVYAALYATELKYEALSQEDRDDFMFYTQRVILGYSYWFLVVSDVLFLTNLLLVYITQLIEEPPKFLTKRHRTGDVTGPPATELRDAITF